MYKTIPFQPNLLLFGVFLYVFSLACEAQELAIAKPRESKNTTAKLAEQKKGKNTLRAVLDKLERTYRVEFNYDPATVSGKTVEEKTAEQFHPDLEKVLLAYLTPLDLQFERLDHNYYIIYESKKYLKKIRRRGNKTAGNKPGQLEHSGNLLRRGNERLQISREKTISGRVTSATDGQPLPGVNILVKGTTTGVVTDADGSYRITVPDDAAVLVFSFIGYSSVEVSILDQRVIDVVMEEEVEALSEVVVVGYGTQERRDLTGSISSVTAEEIDRIPTTSFDAALQGRAPGVLITPNSGQPGGAVDVNIRGVGTFGNNSPLYVIDGVPVFNAIAQVSGGIQTNPLSGIDPGNIESIEILKDASAAAIYGARAANGVIIITTKRGKEGTPTVSFNSYYGTQWFNNFIDMLDSEQFATISTEADINGGRQPQAAWSNPGVLETNTDWQDEFFNPAAIQEYNLTVSGGTASAKYLVGAGYFNQKGIAPNNRFDRYSLRINTDFTVNKHLTIGESVSLSRSHWDGGLEQANDRLQELLQSSPTLPVNDPDNLGGFAGPTSEITGRVNRSNQVAELNLRDIDNFQDRILGNIYAQVNFIEGLSYRLNLGLDAITREGKNFVPVFELGNRSNARATLSESRSDEDIFLLEHTLSYQRTFNNEHKVTALFGYSQQNSKSEFLSGSIQDFPNNDLRQVNAGSGTPSLSGDETEWALRSLLARVNYSFKDKYLFTANFRRDGSSRFGENNRYGNFPSFSVGWRLSEESFMDQMSDVISDLKVRVSWGQVGNQEIADYAFIPRIEPVSNYVLGSGQSLAPGASFASLGNADLKWETTTQTDIGLEVGLFSNQLLLVADYYIKNTEDALLRLPIPVTTGLRRNNGPFVNAAEIRNEGLELALTYRKSINSFNYNIVGHFSTLSNEVVSLGGGAPIIVERSSDPNLATTITEEGGEIGMYYGWVADGLFQSQNEIDELNALSPTGFYQTPGTSPGDIRYRDLNGDGVINAGDRQVIGSSIPDFFYGFNADVGYKNFDVSVFFQGVQGNEIYNLLKAGIQDLEGDNNMMEEVLNRWTPENPNTNIPRAIVGDPNDNDRPSTRFIEDGSYFRLRNITVGYTMPQALTKRIGAGKIRFYLTGQNLFTITDYSAFNPDVGLSINATDEQRTLFRGVDYGTYPVSKVILGGVQVEF